MRGQFLAAVPGQRPEQLPGQGDIRALITGLGDLRDIICDAAASVKAAIYEQLGLQVTYLPEQDKLRADVTISPEKFAGQTDKYMG